MKTEVLLKFIEAGYTKDEIALMEEMETKPAAEQAQEMEKSEEAEAPEEAENPEKETANDNISETINDIMRIIAKMQKTLDGMQQKNVKDAESEAPAKLTADDVIKNFFGNTKKA